VRLEDVRLAIRPRSNLECLDMAFLFCGRHWLGLFVWSAVGILPMIGLNQLLYSTDINLFGMLLIQAMEIPWATLFVTLYLGQVTFTRKISARRIFRDAVRAIPQMLLFQFLVRGACFAIVILSPIVLIGMYFLNEIIVLEKPSILRTWHRRSAMNSRILSRIISLRIMDLGVLLGGTAGVYYLILAIIAIWSDHTDVFHTLYQDPDLLYETAMSPSWPLELSLWIVIIFLTVFRFVTYLDCRIRREGWDVELKLRVQAEQFQRREAAA